MILLISGVLISIVSGIFSYFEKSKDNASANKSNIYNVGILVTLFIGSLMTLISGVQSNISAKNNADKADTLRNKIDSAKDKIIDLQVISQKESARMRDSLDHAKTQIINLQKQSYQSIDRLKNPIPESLDLIFASTLKLSNNDIDQIEKSIKSRYSSNGNFLPFDSNDKNDGIEKINSFKNIMLELNISFHQSKKIMSVTLKRAPLNLYGYNTPNSNNSFTLSYQVDKSIVRFDGMLLKADNITTNYKSPSLLDFEESKVIITYEFFYPKSFQIGTMQKLLYIDNQKDYLLLNIESLRLIGKNYSFDIKNLKQTEANKYEGSLLITTK